ncbi:amino acid adenylation domain-containing protein [Catenuloplanes nepalensis]|uniref:Amino acid adenylation domain-containing protein n=1 Tax=Catenuloplanes nepalensis TaxID=587533 RepID=A0ABT9MM35_9ACTN|nr:amino acid adenylation domain-containing protein [Catenuloplanes nepalensis]MDP9792491.1 amino acid adenylation domain-containing protein [Catenuloplanes nepalensis]
MTDNSATAAIVWSLAAGGATALRPALAPQHLAPRPPRPTGPLCRVRLTGLIDPARLQDAVTAMFATHPALRQQLIDTPAGPCLLTSDHVSPSPAADVSAEPAPGPLAQLVRETDGSFHLTLTPGPCSVDETGLLRAVTTAGTVYRGELPEPESISPQTADEFLAGLREDPAAAGQRLHWRGYEQDLLAPQLSRALMLHATSRPCVSTPVPIDAADQQALRRAAADLGIGVDAIVLAVWRALLLRVAPDENGSLALFVPGPAGQLPGVVGQLGRRVPLPIHVPGNTAGGALLPATAAEIAERHESGDFFAGAPAGGWTVGLHTITHPGPAFGPEVAATVLECFAPVEAVRLDLRLLDTGTQLNLNVLESDDAGRPARTATLGTLLAAMLHRAAHHPGERIEVPEALAAAPLHGQQHTVDGTLISAFIDQAGRTPRAVAARDDQRQLTYDDLLTEVLRLSGLLARFGIQRGERIAVFMNRHVHLLVSALAVMHRGAAFVPIDLAQPPARVAELLKDAGPALVLIDRTAAGTLPGGWHSHFVDDSIPVSLDTGPEEIDRPAGPSDTAYVIYTSGSTGIPKGVPIRHGALVNYLQWAARCYDTDVGTGTLVHSSIAVDMTITSLFLPLLTGGTVTLLPSDEPADLVTALRASRDLSPLKLTPGGLRLVNSLMEPAELSRAVAHLVIGGEQLGRQVLADLPAGLKVTNEYGPTEATVGCCAHTFEAGDDTGDPVAIGLPIWNTELSVQTADGRPALPGIAGELVVTGAGVTEGYLNSGTDLSAKFSVTAAGENSYRTGDLVFRRPDGLLQMTGRLDDQLKIRGYRVEPAEIESVLTSALGVSAAAVVVTTAAGGQVLTAFLVPGPGAPDDLAEQARAAAQTRLAFYARPDRIVVLEQLPLLRSGKVDRQALGHWQPDADAGGAPIEPGDPILSTLSTLWEELLGTAPQGLDANFFAAGADSITAVMLTARASRHGLRLAVRDVMEQRTLRAIASATRGAAPRRAAVDGPVPLSAHQRGVLTNSAAPWDGWTLRWIAELPAGTEPQDLQDATTAVLHEHPALRTVFTPGLQWRARTTEPPPVVIETADLSGLAGWDRDHAVAEVLRRCERLIDLQSRLLQVALLRDGDTRQAAIVAHHLACDVVSLQHIAARLAEPATGRPQPDEAVDDGYLDWLEHSAAGFPTWFPGPQPGAARPSVHTTSLPAEQSRQLLAAFPGRAAAAVLAALTVRAVTDIRPDLSAAACVELHGRDSLATDLAGAVGWFTEFRPLSTSIAALDDLPTLSATWTAQLNQPAPAKSLVHLPPIAVNYLGELAAAHPDLASQGAPPALFPLEVVAWMHADGLQVRWRYDTTFIPAAVLDRISYSLHRHAADLATTTARPAVPGASDIDPADLQRIVDSFEG